VLVLVPTRELANQVSKASRVLRRLNIKAVAVYGGENKKLQIDVLEEGCDILVATPGRLLELLECRQIDLAHVSMLVLDEADKMLELGFEPQLDKISGTVRLDRQSLLFSATFPKKLHQARHRWMHQPIYFQIGDGEINIASSIKQIVQITDSSKKTESLIKLLSVLHRREVNHRQKSRLLVFVNHVQTVDDLTTELKKKIVIPLGALHGKLPQATRDQRLLDFKSGKLQMLICTDVASRGIHIKDLAVVVNYDFPVSLEAYAHRVGRTGRQGKPGVAYTLLSPETDSKWAPGLVTILKETDQKVSGGLVVLAKESNDAKEAAAKVEAERKAANVTK